MRHPGANPCPPRYINPHFTQIRISRIPPLEYFFFLGIAFYNPMQGFLIKLCLRSSNWHFAHFILQFPSTAHLHGNPHETRKGQISQFVTSRQISGKFFPEPDCVQFLAPKHLHHSATKKVLPHFHHPASVSPASGPEGSLV